LAKLATAGRGVLPLAGACCRWQGRAAAGSEGNSPMEQAGAAAPPQSFEIFPLIESLADAMQAGAGDAAIQGLVADLVGRFDACFKALQESNSTLPESLGEQRAQLHALQQHLDAQRETLDKLLGLKTRSNK
ncbi:hypothetical protein CLOM_g12600, partial [Closterium sp. NIES-68]